LEFFGQTNFLKLFFDRISFFRQFQHFLEFFDQNFWENFTFRHIFHFPIRITIQLWSQFLIFLFNFGHKFLMVWLIFDFSTQFWSHFFVFFDQFTNLQFVVNLETCSANLRITVKHFLDYPWRSSELLKKLISVRQKYNCECLTGPKLTPKIT